MQLARKPPRIGRVREPYEPTARGATALWNEIAEAADLGENEHGHSSGLGRIQNAASEDRFVAIIDDLDAVLTAWSDPGEALNLRWALQNVNGLMVVAGAEGPIGAGAPYEHTVLAMTFATQSLQTPADGQ